MKGYASKAVGLKISGADFAEIEIWKWHFEMKHAHAEQQPAALAALPSVNEPFASRARVDAGSHTGQRSPRSS